MIAGVVTVKVKAVHVFDTVFGGTTPGGTFELVSTSVRSPPAARNIASPPAQPLLAAACTAVLPLVVLGLIQLPTKAEVAAPERVSNRRNSRTNAPLFSTLDRRRERARAAAQQRRYQARRQIERGSETTEAEQSLPLLVNERRSYICFPLVQPFFARERFFRALEFI